MDLLARLARCAGAARLFTLVLSCALPLGAGAVVAAVEGAPGARQEPPPEADAIGAACEAPEHRQFDYWIGEWVVRNPDGEQVGSSRISRVSAGCGILEEWTSAQGPPGTSINFYDPSSETWRQTWVGGGGQVLDLEGGLEDGAMTLYGDRETEEGSVRDRIRWILLEDGRVEQLWDVSSDDGGTWGTIFRGLYEPVSR